MGEGSVGPKASKMGAHTLASKGTARITPSVENSASLAAAPSGVLGGTHGGSTCLRSSAAQSSEANHGSRWMVMNPSGPQSTE